jgi:aldose 1-epimerase
MTTGIQEPGRTGKGGGVSVGFIADGTAVDLYVLKEDGIEAAIMTYGARIVSIRTADRYGNMANVVLSYSNLASSNFT